MKFVRIGEDFQEYGRVITNTLLTNEIKQSETYQMFIKYSTGLLPLKKSRGKGSQGKKSDDTPKPISVDVSKESDPEPARKRTSSRRVIKKKVSISAEDNIITEPDVALELGKSMSLTEASEEEAARQVHDTHERIVTESDPEPARRRPSSIAFRDTSSMSKKMSPNPSQKLKGVQILTPKEQLAANTVQALKASRKSIRRAGAKPEVLDEVKDTSAAKANVTLDWGSENKSDYSEEDQGNDEEIPWESIDEDKEKKKYDNADDDKSIDLKETDNEFMHSEEYVQEDDEETDDEFVHEDERVHDDADKEMTDAEDTETGEDDEGITDAEKTEVTKGDLEQAGKPPLTSSRLSVSSDFVNQFLNLSFDTSLIGTLKESADTKINSLLDIQIQQEVPHIQSPSILTVHVSVIPKPSVLSPIPEIPSVAHATSFLSPPSISTISLVIQQTITPIPTPLITTKAPPITMIPDPLPTITQRVSILEKDVQKLKEVDLTTTILASLRSKIPLDDAIRSGQAGPEKILRKRVRDDDNKDEDPSGGPNQGKKTKRSRTKESEPSKRSSTTKASSKGKSPAKTSKSGKSMTAEEPVEEPAFEMAFDDIEQTGDDVVNDVDQPPDDATQTKDKAPNKDCNILFAAKDPLTFDELLATPIDFSKFMMNRLKIDKLTKAHLVGPVYNLLKVQHNLFHLDGDVIVDLAVALLKLPKEAYELNKFLDGTLKKVHDTLYHRLRNFRLGYNNDMPKRKWSATDKKRSDIMVELIDRQMLERRILRNLERLVGVRELEMDYKLMQRTI
ncbi:hypothetical protein Tco_0303261 [Tanacetum coccineum]